METPGEETLNEVLDATPAFVTALAAYTHWPPREGPNLHVTVILLGGLEHAAEKCYACSQPVGVADLALLAYLQDGGRFPFKGLTVCALCQHDPDAEAFIVRRAQGEDHFEVVEPPECPECGELIEPSTLIYLRDLRRPDYVAPRICGE